MAEIGEGSVVVLRKLAYLREETDNQQIMRLFHIETLKTQR
jgi:hypothetical protein